MLSKCEVMPGLGFAAMRYTLQLTACALRPFLDTPARYPACERAP
jgi:hypothetical protein